MYNAKSSIAAAIFSSGAISFGEFTLTSGQKSPYYIDLSRLLTAPAHLERFVKAAGSQIRARCEAGRIEAVASIELRGALLLAALSSYIGRPCYFVRKTAKSHGITGRIVGGEIKSDQRLMLFDDVVTDGQSKLESIKALEDSGAKVTVVLVIVDREEGGRENLGQQGYPVESLLTVHELISELASSQLIDSQLQTLVTSYLEHEGKDAR